jgi:hypothetical protein
LESCRHADLDAEEKIIVLHTHTPQMNTQGRAPTCRDLICRVCAPPHQQFSNIRVDGFPLHGSKRLPHRCGAMGGRGERPWRTKHSTNELMTAGDDDAK